MTKDLYQIDLTLLICTELLIMVNLIRHQPFIWVFLFLPRIKDIIKKVNNFVYLYYLSPKRIIEVTEARVVITTTK